MTFKNISPLQKFCYDHGIKILDCNKRTPRSNAVYPEYFTDPADYNSIRAASVYETEPLYTVEIPESELIKIAEFEQQVFNNMKQRGHYDMFKYTMELKEREKFLREKYPAVQRAYENYSLMLKLSESGEL